MHVLVLCNILLMQAITHLHVFRYFAYTVWRELTPAA